MLGLKLINFGKRGPWDLNPSGFEIRLFITIAADALAPCVPGHQQP